VRSAAKGLISYDANFFDQYRRAAGSVDRVLKGQKPANLPVQQSTKVELIVNLKTAKVLEALLGSTLAILPIDNASISGAVGGLCPEHASAPETR
jgi:ABC-type uncharacterized transport system substrate-binding protein